MRVGKVIGMVTLNRRHPSLAGASYKLAVPLSLADLAGTPGKPAEEFTVYDELGAGIGNLIAISEGREAAQPFYPNDKPVDSYNAAILDTVTVQAADVGERGEGESRVTAEKQGMRDEGGGRRDEG